MPTVTAWRAVGGRKAALHLGELTWSDTGVVGFRFVTRCDRVLFTDSVVDDPRRKRCSRCLATEGQR